MFKRILIANRGEIAVRDHPRMPRAGNRIGRRLLRRRSRRAACARSRLRGTRSARRQRPRAISTPRKFSKPRKQTKADAIHPGYGFFSENARLRARRAEGAGLVLDRPARDAIERMGDKVEARKLMAAAGVPVVPGSPGTLETEAAGRARSRKRSASRSWSRPRPAAAARVCASSRTTKDLASVVRTVASEAKVVVRRRPLLCREISSSSRAISKCRCSPIRTATPSISSSANARSSGAIRRSSRNRRRRSSRPRCAREMGDVAVRAAKAVNYVSAGTIEFLVDADRNFISSK